MNTISKPYESREEILGVVRRFEDCSFPPGEFHHREHLTVVLWYLSQLSPTQSAARMREGLHKFLSHHGHAPHQKYHETITLFWIKKVRALLDQGDRSRPLAEIANEIIEACGDAKLINVYYSRELIAAAAAREGWVEPDLRPLDF